MVSFDLLWDGLGQPQALTFGRAAASSLVWAIAVSILHWTLAVLKLTRLLSLPPALIFSGPPLLKILASKIAFMEGVPPNMPIRIAKSLAGGNDPLMTVILLLPSHCLGTIAGVTFVSFFLTVPEPIQYSDPDDILWWRILALEAGLTALFVLGFHVVPEILRLNGFRGSILIFTIFVLPLMHIGVPDQGAIFCPEYLYTLWYVKKQHSPDATMQSAHLIGPVIGALVAGIFMSRYFPDNSA